MTFIKILFYLFSFLAIISALKVISANNSVESSLFLVFTFINVACIWMLLSAEFLSIILILIYIGAVMVLFLFIVMMLDIRNNENKKSYYIKNILIIIISIFIEFNIFLFNKFIETKKILFTIDNKTLNNVNNFIPNIKLIGKKLYSEYIFAFEIAGIILLVGIIAAIYLTKRRTNSEKYQVISRQVNTNHKNCIRIINIPTSEENKY